MEKNTSNEFIKIIKFIIMGTLSTLIELGIFYFLQNIVFSKMRTQPVEFFFFSFEGPGYLFSYLISTIIGYGIAFILNRKYTFQSNANPVFSITAYFLMVAFTILFTSWLGIFITNLFIQNNLRYIGEIITKPFVAVLAILWTYPINRFIIHKKNSSN